ncbi:MAG: DUF2155 domain-containing protein [Alphaproteobacteria bacterium]|nr:DUF2155 domain-containing protein [Alphaproteobacteria bacterium]
MRFAFVSLAALSLAGAAQALAQDDTPPPPDEAPLNSPSAALPADPALIAPDPALDALGETTQQENELDQLSKSPDDAFQNLDESKKRVGVSVTLRALNKITARYTDIHAPIGKPVRFGALEILPHYCDKRPPEEFPETSAFLEIFDRGHSRSAPAYKDPALAAAVAETSAAKEIQPETDDYSVKASIPQKPFGASDEAGAVNSSGKIPLTDDQAQAATTDSGNPSKPVDPDRIFSGWMFASSPSLNALEDPVYDVWVIDCKTETIDK